MTSQRLLRYYLRALVEFIVSVSLIYDIIWLTIGVLNHLKVIQTDYYWTGSERHQVAQNCSLISNRIYFGRSCICYFSISQ